MVNKIVGAGQKYFCVKYNIRGSTKNFKPLLLRRPPFSILAIFSIRRWEREDGEKILGGGGLQKYFVPKLHFFVNIGSIVNLRSKT